MIFTGLVLALYTWKSFVMISLQNKIIYNPYLPPTARHDKISDYKKFLHGIEWEELRIRSMDRTDLALAVASVSSETKVLGDVAVAYHVYILYCQGETTRGLSSAGCARVLTQRGQGTRRRCRHA